MAAPDINAVESTLRKGRPIAAMRTSWAALPHLDAAVEDTLVRLTQRPQFHLTTPVLLGLLRFLVPNVAISSSRCFRQIPVHALPLTLLYPHRAPLFHQVILNVRPLAGCSPCLWNGLKIPTEVVDRIRRQDHRSESSWSPLHFVIVAAPFRHRGGFISAEYWLHFGSVPASFSAIVGKVRAKRLHFVWGAASSRRYNILECT